MLDQEAFLSQEIASASPAKLRWLLLRKANGVTAMIDGFIEKGETLQAQNWLVLVLDILNELLSGITDPTHPSAKSVSDLYVFLIKETYEISTSLDRSKLKAVREILEIELLTWDLFVKSESGVNQGHSSSSNAFYPHILDGIGQSDSSLLGSLNLEA